MELSPRSAGVKHYERHTPLGSPIIRTDIARPSHIDEGPLDAPALKTRVAGDRLEGDLIQLVVRRSHR